MSEPLIVIVLYRCFSMAIGLVFALLGYRLFVLGIQAKAGDFDAAWGKKYIALKRAGPGTFFALFGVVIVSVNLLKGPSISENITSINTNQIPNDSHNNISIDPRIITLIDKEIKNIAFSNEEVRMWNDWLKKHPGLSRMKSLNVEAIKMERSIILHETKKEENGANKIDNKANSADAKNRAAD